MQRSAIRGFAAGSANARPRPRVPQACPARRRPYERAAGIPGLRSAPSGLVLEKDRTLSRLTKIIRPALPKLKRAIYPRSRFSIFNLPEFSIRVHRFRRCAISPSIAYNNVWEPFESEIIASLLRQGAIFYDIGANIGWYSVLASLCVGESGKVFSFEPDPENYRLLCINIKNNNLENVTTTRAAISDKSGAGTLYRSIENAGDHRLDSETPDRSVQDQVRVLSLHDVIEQGARIPDIIKLDTQGSEAKILCNISELYRISPELIIICEFWPFGLRNCGSNYKDLLDSFSRLSLAAYVIDEATRSLKPTTYDQLDEQVRTDPYLQGEGYLNLLVTAKNFALPQSLQELTKAPAPDSKRLL
jgi:FkbM family methyltransferase